MWYFKQGIVLHHCDVTWCRTVCLESNLKQHRDLDGLTLSFRLMWAFLLPPIPLQLFDHPYIFFLCFFPTFCIHYATVFFQKRNLYIGGQRIRDLIWYAFTSLNDHILHCRGHQQHCKLCDQADETIDHLMVSCVFSRQVWYTILHDLGLHTLAPQTGDRSFEDWSIVHQMLWITSSWWSKTMKPWVRKGSLKFQWHHRLAMLCVESTVHASPGWVILGPTPMTLLPPFGAARPRAAADLLDAT